MKPPESAGTIASMSDGAAFVQRLRNYLSRLEVVLSQGLSKLSAAGVDIPLEWVQPNAVTWIEPSNGVRDSTGRSDEKHILDTGSSRTGDALSRLHALRRGEPIKSQLIVAPFGIGKSTLLSRFAIDLAREALQVLAAMNDPNHPALRVPFPVRLRDINTPQEMPSLCEFLASMPAAVIGAGPDERFSVEEIERWLTRKVGHGAEFICLYDGLDEVSPARKSEVFQLLRRYHGHSNERQAI